MSPWCAAETKKSKRVNVNVKCPNSATDSTASSAQEIISIFIPPLIRPQGHLPFV